jgi:hypothetical protein
LFQRLLKKKAEIQTVPIEEYNKLKEAVEQQEAIRDSLTKENERIMKENEVTLAEIEVLEQDIRVQRIENILITVPFRSEQARSEVLKSLVNSNLSIKDIEDTYSTLKKTIPTVGTKLPQKSIPDKNKEFSYYK